MKKRYKIVNTVIQIIKRLCLKREKRTYNAWGKGWMEINQNGMFRLVSLQVIDKWPFFLEF